MVQTALPIRTATNGLGMAITISTNGYGLPVTQATNGFGIPVVTIPSGGLPVIVVGDDPNLLAGLSWQPWNPFSNSIISTVAGRIRYSAVSSSDLFPGTYKFPVALTAGTQYRIQGTLYDPLNTGRNTNLFIATDINATLGNRAYSHEFVYAPPSGLAINDTFTPTVTGNYYVIGDVDNTQGHTDWYWEMTDNFSLVKV